MGASLSAFGPSGDLARVDLEDGEVGRRVLADQLGLDRVALLAEADGVAVRVLDDMVVGDDVAGRVDHEARAGGRAAAALALEGELAVAAAGGDEDDAAGDPLVEVGHAGGRGAWRVGGGGLRGGRRRGGVALGVVGERPGDGEDRHHDSHREGAEEQRRKMSEAHDAITLGTDRQKPLRGPPRTAKSDRGPGQPATAAREAPLHPLAPARPRHLASRSARAAAPSRAPARPTRRAAARRRSGG